MRRFQALGFMMEMEGSSRVNHEPEEEIIEIEEYSNEGEEFAQRTLVGKILFAKVLNKAAAKSIIAKAWGEPDRLKVVDMGPNIYMFTFKNKMETQEILRRGPWYIMNHLISLQYWIPEVSAYEVDYTGVSFWVQLHGMPLGTMTCKNATQVMERFGEVREVENSLVDGNLYRDFMRVRVLLNVLKPLPVGCWIPRKDLPKTWIVFRFERLQDLCYKCGILGHDFRSCHKVWSMMGPNKDVHRFGPELAAPPARPLSSIAANFGRWNKGGASAGTTGGMYGDKRGAEDGHVDGGEKY